MKEIYIVTYIENDRDRKNHHISCGWFEDFHDAFDFVKNIKTDIVYEYRYAYMVIEKVLEGCSVSLSSDYVAENRTWFMFDNISKQYLACSTPRLYKNLVSSVFNKRCVSVGVW